MFAAVVIEGFDQRRTCEHRWLPAERVIGETDQIVRPGCSGYSLRVAVQNYTAKHQRRRSDLLCLASRLLGLLLEQLFLRHVQGDQFDR
jgi:hypothetical protein